MYKVLEEAPVADWVTPDLIMAGPEETADRLRAESPVAYVPFFGGIVISRFDLIQEFLTDTTKYSAVDADGGTTDRAVGPSLMRQDDPEHGRQRQQIMKGLRPRAVEAHWAAVFAKNAAKRIDELIAAGPGANLDMVFSRPFAADNLAAVVGLPDLQYTDLIRWSHAMTAGSANLFDDQQVWDTCDAAREEADSAIEAAIPYLRRNPDSSMLSVMVNSEDQLPHEVIKANVKLAMSGGVSEPQHTVTNGVWTFTKHPEQLSKALADPALFMAAFDEVVRVLPPIHLTVKKSAQRDVGLNGIRIPSGSSVISFFLAGNLDPARFENPTVFDISRERHTSLTFGTGAHGCAGSFIAKAAIGGVAWPELYRRLPGLRAVDPNSVKQGGFVFRGLPELPVTWDSVAP